MQAERDFTAAQDLRRAVVKRDHETAVVVDPRRERIKGGIPAEIAYTAAEHERAAPVVGKIGFLGGSGGKARKLRNDFSDELICSAAQRAQRTGRFFEFLRETAR